MSRAREVTTDTAKRGSAAEVVYATGNVEPVHWAKVTALSRKRIVEICKCEGKVVKKGERARPPRRRRGSHNTASAMTYGIENAVAFTNSGSGLIKIDRTTSGGIWNQSTGTFTNSATLNIGSLAAIGQRCIYNSGTFNNNTGGIINANNASLYGIEHISGTFTNAATINIGSTATAGTYGLRNSSTFNNNTGGTIKIDRSTSFGLRNNAGTFTNAATVNIGSLVAVGTTGISNAATITNSASGTINIDRVTIRGIINVTGTITNAGIVNIGALAASSMSYGIENDAAFANNGSGQININRSTTYGIWNDAGTFTNAATLNIGSTAAVGTRCIYNENTFSNNTRENVLWLSEILVQNAPVIEC